MPRQSMRWCVSMCYGFVATFRNSKHQKRKEEYFTKNKTFFSNSWGKTKIYKCNACYKGRTLPLFQWLASLALATYPQKRAMVWLITLGYYKLCFCCGHKNASYGPNIAPRIKWISWQSYRRAYLKFLLILSYILSYFF